ncbi:MAG TPA: GntR family transcriptional regulator [Bacillota bacterium]
MSDSGDIFRNLDLNPERPIYLQIIEAFRLAVARGALAPGDQIPSQRDLAQQLRVNPNTVQRAYREMEYLGLVETRRGMGTFISPDPERWLKVREETIDAELARFIEIMVQLGCTREQIVGLVSRAVDSLEVHEAGGGGSIAPAEEGEASRG